MYICLHMRVSFRGLGCTLNSNPSSATTSFWADALLTSANWASSRSMVRSCGALMASLSSWPRPSCFFLAADTFLLPPPVPPPLFHPPYPPPLPPPHEPCHELAEAMVCKPLMHPMPAESSAVSAVCAVLCDAVRRFSGLGCRCRGLGPRA